MPDQKLRHSDSEPSRWVEQTSLYDGTGTKGNCVAACVASIFGVTLGWLEEKGIVPGSGFQDVASWTSEHWPGLEYRERDLCTNFRVVEGEGRGGEDDRWEYDLPDPETHHDPPACGYWIAHVVSPRGFLKSGPYRGMPIQHAVVMRGANMVWDPHPQRDMGVGQLVGMGWWIVRDPLLLRRKWEPCELTGLGEEERDAA